MIQLAIDIDTASIDARLSALDQVLDTTPPLGDISDAALPTLRVYPPELPNQRYQRTGTLGRGWRASAAGAVITLDNPVGYAGAVYGPNQRAIFAGRWPQKQQQVQSILPGVLAAYQEWVERMVRG